MRSILSRLLGQPEATVRPSFEEHQIAAGALLVEAARMDGHIGADEWQHIEAVLGERFGLGPDEAASLLRHAQDLAGESADWHSFTRTIKEAYDEPARIEMIELLWQVVLVDGVLHDHEASLMRRIAGLLYVSGRDSAEARGRALAALNPKG